MKLVVSLLLVMFTLNLKAELRPTKIIGDNDLVAVDPAGSNIPTKYKKLLDAFGLMNMGCTATHIGNGIVITAGHCFWAPDTLSQDLPCEDTTIDWGVREGKTSYMQSKCEKILFAQRNSIDNDFAIIKVSPAPDVAVEVELKRKAVAGDEVTIFSHPEELPLRWSKSCVVESNQDTELPPQAMQHKCDTNPGSSGATVLDVNTLKVVAIHDGGRLTSPTEGMNYGTYMTNPEILNSLNSLGFQ